MKTTLFKIAIILTLAILSFQCSEKDSIEKPCKYGDIVLDTNNLVIIDSNDLKGRWGLVGYFDLSDCSLSTKPENDVTAQINFFTNTTTNIDGFIRNFLGYTSCNRIEGLYKLDSDKIEIINLRTTQIGCSDWDNKFYNNLWESDYITIQNNTLLIFYEQSQKVMVLTKI